MKPFVVNSIDAFFLLTVFGLGLPALCALALHHIEQGLFGVLSRRFGVKAVVYLTGWLGTPVHELSHAALCPIFGHTINEFQPFKPDFETGTLGYVKHTPGPGIWSRLGGFFIGIAPLLGGSLALCLLTWLCTGVNLLAMTPALSAQANMASPGETIYGFFRIALHTLGALTHMRYWFLWPVFVYGSLCIGAHMAPSGADLKNGLSGLVLLLVLFGLVSLTVGGLEALDVRVVTIGQLFYILNLAVAPVVLLLMLSIVLNGANLMLMWLLCSLPGGGA
ncbi:MAG: hypothetical protein ACREJ2_08465 [Planctomycetota bacterium]